MKQITLHVYQSIDGCPVIADKCFNAAVDACAYVLIDEETYLRIYLNNLDWPLEAKETLVVTNGCIDLTETERVRFVRGNVVTELRRIKENGDGMVVAYGGETGVLLLDNGLADEIVMTTVPVLVGNGEKGLECGPNDGRIWAVRSSEVLEDGKIRPVYGRLERHILEYYKCATMCCAFVIIAGLSLKSTLLIVVQSEVATGIWKRISVHPIRLWCTAPTHRSCPLPAKCR